MRKKDLRQNMIVKSSDGRYGIVCMKDATDENCIKFFYDPTLSIAHGSVERSHCGDFIVPLSQFTEDLKYICTKKEAKELGLIASNEILTLWFIEEVYTMSRRWIRTACMASCNHILVVKEKYDNQVVGCCKLKNNEFIGTMEDIHCGEAYCIACEERRQYSMMLDPLPLAKADVKTDDIHDTKRL